MLDIAAGCSILGWPKRHRFDGWHLRRQGKQGRYPDTKSATLDFSDLTIVWQHRSWGDPIDPRYLLGATFYGEKGTLKAGVYGYDFTPLGEGKPVHGRSRYELSSIR